MKLESSLGMGFSRFVLGLRCDEGGVRVLTRDRAILGADILCTKILENFSMVNPVDLSIQATLLFKTC